MNNKLLDAARAFLHQLRVADEKTKNEAYQRLAYEANGSQWGQTHEPLQGICLAFQADERQRIFNRGEDSESDL